jgi:hypothetical protein
MLEVIKEGVDRIAFPQSGLRIKKTTINVMKILEKLWEVTDLLSFFFLQVTK